MLISKKASVLVVLLLVSAGCSSFNNPAQVPKQDSQTVQVSPQKVINTENLIDQDYPNSKRYFSEKLGVGFYHLLKLDGKDYNIKITENDNKIYVFQGSDSKSGQYVEVYTKSPNQNLVQAIKEKFLVDYPNCEVWDRGTRGSFNGHDNFPTTYITAGMSIKIPDNQKDVNGYPKQSYLFAHQSDCPLPYGSDGGVQYFIADQNYPSKYVFVNIGQYNLWGAENKDWEETIFFK